MWKETEGRNRDMFQPFDDSRTQFPNTEPSLISNKYNHRLLVAKYKVRGMGFRSA